MVHLRVPYHLKIAIQKNRKIRYLFDRVLGLFQGRLYFTSSDKVVLEKSMSVFFTYFVGISAKKEKKKEKSCFEESL